MPCYSPLQATYQLRDDGKKEIIWDEEALEAFRRDTFIPNQLSLPCGNCIGCRLERSRQWAVRITHEASMYPNNCFITLTINDDHIEKICPKEKGGYSLNRKTPQNFLKRLRRHDEYHHQKQNLEPRKIRAFYSGEYGDDNSRPHYHMCLFNYHFEDQKYWKHINNNRYYCSDLLNTLWPYGYSSISELNFDTAAYVARYCVKKINGKQKEEHYQGKLPEFCQASLKPGIGSSWLDKYGETDAFNHDEIVVNGHKCKLPRYYDKYLEKKDPIQYSKAKEQRELNAEKNWEDNTYKRLLTKQKCKIAQFKQLVRTLSDGSNECSETTKI